MRNLLTLSILLISMLTLASSVQSSPVDIAKTFIGSLGEQERGLAMLPFDSPKRTDWHYFPRERDGYPIGKMTEEQKEILWALLSTVLSEKGVEKVKGVLRLEEVLFARENSPGRDPGNFQLVIWGDPAEGTMWGWRFEGHHLSINITCEGARVASVTPSFLGANPATVGEGEWKGFRNLSETEDLGREWMLSLSREERSKALIDSPLTDVESAGLAQIEIKTRPGLTLSWLSGDRQAQVRDLLEVYTGLFREEILASLGLTPERLLSDPGLTFEWKGGLAPGELHTYRIGGQSFDIQYANNQSAANHIHVLIRTVGRDFGL